VRVKQATPGKHRNEGNFGLVSHVREGTRADNTRRGTMNVIEFFEYLATHEQTNELAHDLADAWAHSEVVERYEPAA
jgi:hypothetical protein